MIKEKTVVIIITPRNVTKYKDLGYDCNINSDLEIRIEDLAKTSKMRITALCDMCGKEISNVTYIKYNRAYERSGSYCCKECGIQKRAMRNMEKYGVDCLIKLPEFLEKSKKTIKEKYGVDWASQAPEVKRKIHDTFDKKYGGHSSRSAAVRKATEETNMKRYGCKNPMQSKEVQDKLKMSLLERYSVESAMQVREFRQKQAESMYMNGSTPCSKQQHYLFNLYGGCLNYPVKGYSLDIAFLSEFIYVEYCGVGHNLVVKRGEITQEQFDQKEIIRNNILKREGWKCIVITSRRDKIPSDEILLEMLAQSKQYFYQYPKHSWIEWDIDKGLYRNAENATGVVFNFGNLRSLRNVEVA